MIQVTDYLSIWGFLMINIGETEFFCLKLFHPHLCPHCAAGAHIFAGFPNYTVGTLRLPYLPPPHPQPSLVHSEGYPNGPAKSLQLSRVLSLMLTRGTQERKGNKVKNPNTNYYRFLLRLVAQWISEHFIQGCSQADHKLILQSLFFCPFSCFFHLPHISPIKLLSVFKHGMTFPPFLAQANSYSFFTTPMKGHLFLRNLP